MHFARSSIPNCIVNLVALSSFPAFVPLLKMDVLPKRDRAALIDVVFPVPDGPVATTMGQPIHLSITAW